jgi:hypothetical protein
MVLSPPAAAVAGPVLVVVVGISRMRALDVFFWRSEYVAVGVLRRAAVGEGWRVSLGGGGCWLVGAGCEFGGLVGNRVWRL